MNFCCETVRTLPDGVEAAVGRLDGTASSLRGEPQHLLARKARTASRDEVHALDRLVTIIGIVTIIVGRVRRGGDFAQYQPLLKQPRPA